MKKLIITDYHSLQEELRSIDIDTTKDILFLSQSEFFNLLYKFRNGLLTDTDLDNIANLIECKDGILFENEYVQESVHKIANIDIQWVNMSELVRWILEK